MTPVISGTAAGQTVAAGQDINPFANVTITDGNDYLENDTLTISLLDANGQPTDANGSLVLPADALGNANFSETSTGVYTLVENAEPSPIRDLSHFQPQLAALTFIPSGSGTTTFALYNNDAIHDQSDSTTTVTASGSGPALGSAAPIDTPAATASVDAIPLDSTAPVDTTATADAAPLDSAAPVDTATPPATTQPNDQTISGQVPSGTTKTVDNGSVLTIDHPHRFHGTTDLISGVVDLNRLAAADSYSFNNDILSIYSANGTTLDQLAFTPGSSAFSVEKVGGGISIYTADDTRHVAGTLLPSS